MKVLLIVALVAVTAALIWTHNPLSLLTAIAVITLATSKNDGIDSFFALGTIVMAVGAVAWLVEITLG
jgi:hypothetical protein